MSKIVLAATAISVITAIAVYAEIDHNAKENDGHIARWETLAEQGDTAAMHRLIEFYNENSAQLVEVVEIIDPDGNEVPLEEIEKQNEENKLRHKDSDKYIERLNYWLDKGVAMDDPVALATKGMRLYYEDESEAISFLSRAADAGHPQAALFCGSACLNQHRDDEAFKYLSFAYSSGITSAGWHLAMCYSFGKGTTPNRDKAVEVMRQSAMLNYPEAVSEMRRIEPDNYIWHQKADSLDITFPDFPIIQ